MYRSLYAAETVSGTTGVNVDLNVFNAKKLHLMIKVTFELATAELSAFAKISAYGKDGTTLYKNKEYVFNSINMDSDRVITLSDTIDVEAISGINIHLYTGGSWEDVNFDVEIETKESGLC